MRKVSKGSMTNKMTVSKITDVRLYRINKNKMFKYSACVLCNNGETIMKDAKKAKAVITTLERLGYIDTALLKAHCHEVSPSYLRYLMHKLGRAKLVEAKPKRYVKTDAWQLRTALKVVGVKP